MYRPKLDVAFVVDTTGSMKDDIRAVKDSLFDIVEKVVTRTKGLSIRFGIVSYRDHPPQDRTYVTRIFDFTSNIKTVHKEISKLKPSEGGDTPEAVADGLHDARSRLSWDMNAYKVLLLVGDAPPHGREYNSLADDHFPDGCPKGHDPKNEVRELKRIFGTTVFIFVCGCNPLVKESFKSIAQAVEGGRYYSLQEAHELPNAILEILEGVSDLIEADRRVLAFYQANDGSFDIGAASSELGLELREMKTSLSRLLELGKIPEWPKGRPLEASQMGLSVVMGNVPDALVAGKPFKYDLRVKNPSSAVVGIRIIVSLITEDGVSEVTNERHEVSPNTDQIIGMNLVPMSFEKGKASIRIQVLYGSKSLQTKIYNTRLY
ncbi:MAG: vWA domain-containing protein [Candidatus Thorarchaeota archaeon SMTZ1-83]